MRRVAGPVRANLAGTVSPTARCLFCAVVESMSSSPWARAAEVPDVMRRITVLARLLVDTAASLDSVFWNSNRPPYTVVVAVTPGTWEAVEAAELLSSADPVGVTMRSALMAWCALLVVERDTEAPNTDIAATRARPTMSAAAVWAVRRGLRIEFSRPSLPGSPSTRASGRRPPRCAARRPAIRAAG